MFKAVLDKLLPYQFICPKCKHAHDLVLSRCIGSRGASIQCFCKTSVDLKPHAIFGWRKPIVTVRE